jgi:hypothetical protein
VNIRPVDGGVISSAGSVAGHGVCTTHPAGSPGVRVWPGNENRIAGKSRKNVSLLIIEFLEQIHSPPAENIGNSKGSPSQRVMDATVLTGTPCLLT